MEVVPFKPKSNPPKAAWLPEDALEAVLDKLRNGEINPTTLVITWTSVETDGRTHEYVTANTEGMAAAVGLLEITKTRMMKSL